MFRDFTYIADIVKSISLLLCLPPSSGLTSQQDKQSCPSRILNIGSSSPISLLTFIDTLEEVLGTKAIRNYMPMQPGDVVSTYSDCSKLHKLINFSPTTSVEDGIRNFVKWYHSFYN